MRSDVLVVALSLERAGPPGSGGAAEQARPEGRVEIVVTPLPFRGSEPEPGVKTTLRCPVGWSA